MQVQNVAISNTQTVVKTQVTVEQASPQATEKTKPVEAVDAAKVPSFSLTLEAYSDCV